MRRVSINLMWAGVLLLAFSLFASYMARLTRPDPSGFLHWCSEKKGTLLDGPGCSMPVKSGFAPIVVTFDQYEQVVGPNALPKDSGK